MNVEIGTEATQFLFLRIFVLNFRCCVFTVQFIKIQIKGILECAYFCHTFSRAFHLVFSQLLSPFQALKKNVDR
jgi:hypothetical protein